MKRFKNVLVVYDDTIGGDDVIGQAVALARKNLARLMIVTVLRENQLSPAMINETGKRLQRLADGVVHAGISEVETKVLTGSAYVQIIREVIAAQQDLVIIGANSGNGIKDVFFGSTTTHLMRKCPCPVLVVKPGQSVPFVKIMAAVDPQPMGGQDHLNTEVMELATSLASRDHAVLHIVYAWEIDGNDYDTFRSEISTEQRAAILDRHRKKNGSALADLLTRYPMTSIAHQLHLPRGRPEQTISRIVEQEQIDLIVMGTVARTGIPGLLVGNSAEFILSSVKCGVLAIKPDGFETPVSMTDRSQVGPREYDADALEIRHII